MKGPKNSYTVEAIRSFIRNSNLIENVYGEEHVDRSLEAWALIENKKTLSVMDILEVHESIMRNLNPEIAGKIREYPVYVGGREGYPPYALQNELLRWCKHTVSVNTEQEIKESHIWFEFIHPFGDGNGRTGRLLMLWQRFKANLALAEVRYVDRNNYYKWFLDPLYVNKYSWRNY